MNDTVTIEGRPLCQECAVADLQAKGNPKPEAAKLRRQADPTICCNCHADFGSSILPTLGSRLPVCEPCRITLLHRPYPNWVKLSFAGLVALAVLSVIVNWRFTVAYWELKKATRQMQSGRAEPASALMASAARRVPESAELADAAVFYRGIYLLGADRSGEALKDLREYAQRHVDQSVAELVSQAEGGAAFDGRDYDTFLSKVQEQQARHPGDAMFTAAVASAYACKYVATGDESFRTRTIEALAKAKTLAGGDSPQMGEYEQRIRCRLETREILSLTDYKKRYPNGWKGGAQ